MPATGRKPKPQGQSINRNKPTYEWVEVPAVPFEGGPELPDTRCDGKPWGWAARRKWNVWRRMPHASLWCDSDWQFALDTIELAARFLEKADPKYGTELRNRERILGTTHDYRRDLRIRYVDPVTAEPVNDDDVVKLDDYRNL